MEPDKKPFQDIGADKEKCIAQLELNRIDSIIKNYSNGRSLRFSHFSHYSFVWVTVIQYGFILRQQKSFKTEYARGGFLKGEG